VFGYSDEDGTEAATLPDKIDEDVVRARVAQVTALVDEVMAQRAEDRIGETVHVLIESLDFDTDEWALGVGRAGHQGPDDSGTVVRLDGTAVEIGDIVEAVVIDVEGVDLVTRLVRRANGA